MQETSSVMSVATSQLMENPAEFSKKIKNLTHNKLEFSFSNLKAASTTQSDVSFNIMTYHCCPCIIQKSHKRKKYSSEFLWLPYW